MFVLPCLDHTQKVLDEKKKLQVLGVKNTHCTQKDKKITNNNLAQQCHAQNVQEKLCCLFV